jgi:hypothetical protein
VSITVGSFSPLSALAAESTTHSPMPIGFWVMAPATLTVVGQATAAAEPHDVRSGARHPPKVREATQVNQIRGDHALHFDVRVQYCR